MDASESADGEGAGESDGRCTCKVGRSARAYGLDGLDGRLRSRHADGASLRELERAVNVALVRAARREAAGDVLGDAGAVYDALTGETGSAGRRVEVRDRLARAGVDVDGLRDAFVSYGTVRTHLRDCLGVDTGRGTELSLSDGRGTVEWARSRSEGIVARTLERLADAGELTAGSPDVTHAVRVTCEDCGVSRPVEEFLTRGGCDCDTADG